VSLPLGVKSNQSLSSRKCIMHYSSVSYRLVTTTTREDNDMTIHRGDGWANSDNDGAVKSSGLLWCRCIGTDLSLGKGRRRRGETERGRGEAATLTYVCPSHPCLLVTHSCQSDTVRNAQLSALLSLNPHSLPASWYHSVFRVESGETLNPCTT
jgi:hypothetical protein